MKRIISLWIFALLSVLAVRADVLVLPTDSAFTYVGRHSLTTDGYVRWTWPYFQFYCSFTGQKAIMKVKPGSGFFVVEVDGQSPRKLEVGKESDELVLAQGLSAGTHTLHVAYVIEGAKRRPEFRGLLLDDGAHIGRGVVPERKMEFIGNSITCALGNEWTGGKNYNQSMQNQYYSYEAIACRELNAQCQVVARSGLGMYRNTLGNPDGDKAVMPAFYPYADLAMSGALWDFSRYQPDVVCIGLGTNDTTNPKYYVDKLADKYTQFVKDLRARYPKAKFVLLTGTMLKANSKRLADLKQALQMVVDARKAEGDNEIYRFDFTPADGSLGYGYGMHPSKKQHELMASELVPFIKTLMNW